MALYARSIANRIRIPLSSIAGLNHNNNNSNTKQAVAGLELLLNGNVVYRLGTVLNDSVLKDVCKKVSFTFRIPERRRLSSQTTKPSLPIWDVAAAVT